MSVNSAGSSRPSSSAGGNVGRTTAPSMGNQPGSSSRNDAAKTTVTAQNSSQRPSAPRLSSVPTPTPRPDRDSFTPAKAPSRDGKTEIRGGYTAKTVRVDPKVSTDDLKHSFMTDPSFSPPISAPRPTPLMFSAKKTGPSQSFTPRGSTPSAHMLQPNRERVGALSERFESGTRGPGTVSSGKGDPGGISYGTYQLSEKKGTAAEFVRSLRDSHPDYYAALSGAEPGTKQFTQAWKELTDRDEKGFERAQHDYMKASLYDPARIAIQKETGLDVDTRTHTLREVVASIAVQHHHHTKDIFARALQERDPATVSDEELIRDLYTERSREGSDSKLAYFQNSPLSQQPGLRARFNNESQAALERLAHELE